MLPPAPEPPRAIRRAGAAPYAPGYPLTEGHPLGARRRPRLRFRFAIQINSHLAHAAPSDAYMWKYMLSEAVSTSGRPIIGIGDAHEWHHHDSPIIAA